MEPWNIAKNELPILAKNDVINFFGEFKLDITSESVNAIITPPIKNAKVIARNGRIATFFIL
jgi:hypothetical protein